MFSFKKPTIEIETVKINSHCLQLPKEICSNPKVFDEFFSFETWKSLSSPVREHLTSNFLPDFCEDNSEESEKTLNMLLSRKIKNFDIEVLNELQKNLTRGSLSSIKKNKKNKLNKKGKLKGFDECQKIFRLNKKLMNARNKLLSGNNSDLLTKNLSGYPLSAIKIYKQSRYNLYFV